MGVTKISLVEDTGEVRTLGELTVPAHFYSRLSLGSSPLDELFGGAEMPGILPGTSFLVTGTPGAGKSTLCLQLADRLQERGNRVLYNLGEENVNMVKMRADRLGLAQRFSVSQFAEVDDLADHVVRSGTTVLFQDSIQSLYEGGLAGRRQLLNIVKKLQLLSKELQVTVFMVGHVTKGNVFAGPQEIKHDVDAHAHMTANPDGSRTLALQKNRFGPAFVEFRMDLSANGVEVLRPAGDTSAQAKEVKASPGERVAREDVPALVRRLLLSGERLSGYCHERFRADVPGGTWRAIVFKEGVALAAEGHHVYTKKVDNRNVTYVDLSKKGKN